MVLRDDRIVVHRCTRKVVVASVRDSNLEAVTKSSPSDIPVVIEIFLLAAFVYNVHMKNNLNRFV